MSIYHLVITDNRPAIWQDDGVPSLQRAARVKRCNQIWRIAAIGAVLCLAAAFVPAFAQQSAAEHPANLYDPVPDPKAQVVAGHARFTVLTPQLIRMEWAADGKFEDHASLVFLNRQLPVPNFGADHDKVGGITIKTDALLLRYHPAPSSDGRFTAENLSITFTLNGKPVTWHPGMPDTGNLQGTTRTLDGALGGKTKEPIEPGLISRDGWALVDDSSRPLFDSTDFRFCTARAARGPG